jgi:ppGpp synthetase/RelA/SpoT-type nucleotidyltranferase
MTDDDLVERYTMRIPLLEEVAGGLAREANDACSDYECVDRIAFQVKEPKSFASKAVDPSNSPPYRFPLREIEDQVAGRVIVYFLDDLAEVRNRLERVFNTIEWTVRRPKPDAEFGYESEHLVCVIPPHVCPSSWQTLEDPPTTFEIQIRTVFMHAYAQPQHKLAYKQGGPIPPNIRRRLAWIAASAWGADQFYQAVARDLKG